MCPLCGKNPPYMLYPICRDCFQAQLIESETAESAGRATDFENWSVMQQIQNRERLRVKRSIISMVLLTENARKTWPKN
jgi:hypothetical protein